MRLVAAAALLISGVLLTTASSCTSADGAGGAFGASFCENLKEGDACDWYGEEKCVSSTSSANSVAICDDGKVHFEWRYNCGGPPPTPSEGTKIADPEKPCETMDAPGEPSARITLLDPLMDVTLTSAAQVIVSGRYAARGSSPNQTGTSTYSNTPYPTMRWCVTPAGAQPDCDFVELPEIGGAGCVGPLALPDFVVQSGSFAKGDNVVSVELSLHYNDCNGVQQLLASTSDEMIVHLEPAP